MTIVNLEDSQCGLRGEVAKHRAATHKATFILVVHSGVNGLRGGIVIYLHGLFNGRARRHKPWVSRASQPLATLKLCEHGHHVVHIALLKHRSARIDLSQLVFGRSSGMLGLNSQFGGVAEGR